MRGEGGGGPNANPAPKRRKVDEDNKYSKESTARIETITPNMGEKRKIQNVEIADNIEKDNHKANRRKKGFQQDIRLFTVTVDQNDGANDMQNNLNNEIDYRPSVPKDPEIADHADYRCEYKVGVGTAEQN